MRTVTVLQWEAALAFDGVNLLARGIRELFVRQPHVLPPLFTERNTWNGSASCGSPSGAEPMAVGKQLLSAMIEVSHIELEHTTTNSVRLELVDLTSLSYFILINIQIYYKYKRWVKNYSVCEESAAARSDWMGRIGSRWPSQGLHVGRATAGQHGTHHKGALIFELFIICVYQEILKNYYFLRHYQPYYQLLVKFCN